MALDFKMDSNKIKGNSKIYFVYFLIISFFGFLFIYTGKSSYTKISLKLNELKELKSDIEALNNKIDSLKLVDKEGYSDISHLTVSFPEEDPILFAYSQLKELSYQRSVVLQNVEFGLAKVQSDTISNSKLSFEIFGTKENVINYISEIESIAPLLGIGEISFAEYSPSGQEFTISASVDVYYSPYPKTLPSVDSAIVPLNENEKKAYKTLSELSVLVSQNIIADSGNTDEDPFTAKTFSATDENEEE